jgi:hypothetical protein
MKKEEIKGNSNNLFLSDYLTYRQYMKNLENKGKYNISDSGSEEFRFET